MSILSNDVNRLEKFLNDGMNSLFRLLVMVLGIGGLLVAINWQLALVALLPVPLIAAFTYLFIQTIQPKYAQVRSTVGKVNSRLENNLGGIQVIKSSTTEATSPTASKPFPGSTSTPTGGRFGRESSSSPACACSRGSASSSLSSSAGSGSSRGHRARSRATSAPACSSSSSSTPSGSSGPWPSSARSSTCTSARASSARIFGLMDEPNRVGEEPDAPDLEVTEGRVEYDDVSFGYGEGETRPDAAQSDGDRRESGDDETILENIDFTVEGGETLALVGPTGAGKSTVLKLLLRMYDVDEGEIRVDGQRIRDVTSRACANRWATSARIPSSSTGASRRTSRTVPSTRTART